MEDQLCTLCGMHPAIQKNSHIIPSFMIAQVCSYDGSGKRDKEVMFTMSAYEDTVYTGQIPSTKLDELFDTEKLTEERIENELKNNTAAKDNIFCPECEKNISIYLESPYAEYMHNGRQIDSATAYFFWMSIAWRMSISGQFNFCLPPVIETNLREKLHAFIEARKTSADVDVNELIRTCLFRYRLIISPDYLKDNEMAGYFGGYFDYNNNILSVTMGDKILCVTFNENPLPANYSFMGFETELKEADINNGLETEHPKIVTKERFSQGVNHMIKETAHKRLLNEKEKADTMWRGIGLPGEGMPMEIFVLFIQRLYSEECKQGDRKTRERYVELFNETLQSFGYVLC